MALAAPAVTIPSPNPAVSESASNLLLRILLPLWAPAGTKRAPATGTRVERLRGAAVATPLHACHRLPQRALTQQEALTVQW
ncbi:hypothetical protein GCM10009738_45620 [Kitasatospora viridis]